MANNRNELNKNLAQMLKGGVIMDVTTPEQARIAQDAGACAVMALERIPADIRAAGGVSRMSDPAMIKGIQEAVSIPVMAKVRIGHIAEARILQAIEIDYIDESEVLSPADDVYHIDKNQFDVPFVCGAKNLGEALRRIAEGASMIRTKGEPGTGDVIQAVRHMRTMNKQIRELVSLRDDEVYEAAKQLAVPYDLAKYVHDNGRLPVVNFAAGGVATPADAALMMELGAEGVFVGSGIFKSGDPAKRAAAIVQATANWQDADLLARLSENLGEAMVGINELLGKVDSLLIIPNDRLKFATDQKVTLANAFEIADDVLRQAVVSISDLIKNTGFINLDFADVTCVMKDAGFAHMGVGRAAGKGKAEDAARMAVASPLMETSINGARGVLINITGSEDMGLEDVETAANLVQEAAHPDANIIFGASFDPSLDDEIRVSVIATGFDEPGKAQAEQAAAAPAQAPAAGLYTAAATAAKAAAPAAAPAAPATPAPAAAPAADAAAPAEEDPFDSIFKIFNSK